MQHKLVGSNVTFYEFGLIVGDAQRDSNPCQSD